MNLGRQDDDIALEQMTLVERAEVFKGEQLAGYLTRLKDGGVEFAYTEEWVRNAGAPVASTLPVTSTPVRTPGGAVPAYFAGLLPEGRRLSALRANVKTSADDELSLLLAVGADVIGDVRVLPEGSGPSIAQPMLSVASFAEVRFADLLRELGIQTDRVGLPGVQDKVSGAMLNLPVSAVGSSILLKLNPVEFKHLVENEHFFLDAARRSGLRVVEASLVSDQVGEQGLAVARFDRVPADGGVRRLPVEDGCQVLGLHPAQKYRVTTEAVFAGLASLCEAPVPAAAEYLAQIAYAYLTGNGDAHAKNFSVMQDAGGRWLPTPAYDLPSSQLYGDQSMALSLDGRRDGNIAAARFVALGDRVGLREKAVRKALARVADAADLWVDELPGLPFDSGKLQKLKRVVQNRQRMLRLP